jgi:hypothetical protein
MRDEFSAGSGASSRAVRSVRVGFMSVNAPDGGGSVVIPVRPERER